jgi:hypothetical protein
MLIFLLPQSLPQRLLRGQVYPNHKNLNQIIYGTRTMKPHQVKIYLDAKML